MSIVDEENAQEWTFSFPTNVKECNQLLQEENYGPLKICMGKLAVRNEDSAILGKSLSTASKLTHFFLIYSRLLSPVVENIMTGLRKCHSLVHLDFTGARMGDAGVTYVARFMRKSKSLLILNLDHNRLSAVGGTKLAENLEFNRTLSVLTLRKNKMGKTVIRPFLSALKKNKSLISLDLGNLESNRIRNALKNNELYREVAFDNVLAKPDLQKTALAHNKINIVGEKECGKTRLLEGLITAKTIDKDELRRARKRTANSIGTTNLIAKRGTIENFPKITIRNVQTFSKLGLWEENFDPWGRRLDYLTEHAMKATHMLLTRKTAEDKAKEKEMEEEEKANDTSLKLKSKLSTESNKSVRSVRFKSGGALLAQLSLGRKKDRKSIMSRASTVSGGSGSGSEDASEDGDYDDFFDISKSKTGTFRSAGSYTSMKKDSIRKTKPNLGTMRSINLNSVVNGSRKTAAQSLSPTPSISDVESVGMFSLDDESVFGRGASLSISTTTTDSEDSGDYENKQVSFQEVTTTKKKEQITDKEASVEPVEDVDEDTADDEELNVNLEEYVLEAELEYDTFDWERSSLAAYKELREKYKEEQEKQSVGNRKTRVGVRGTLRSNPPEDEFDKHLRAFSMTPKKGDDKFLNNIMRTKSNRKKSIATARTGKERTSLFSNTINGPRQRRSRLKNRKATQYMRRDFSDKTLMNVKTRPDGIKLSFWEFSENYYYDSMFSGLYSTLMSGDSYGLTVLCFDLSRVLRNKSHGRKSLIYYLNLAKTKAESNLVLVGTKLDKIKSHQDLANINLEVKKALKDTHTKSVLVNSQARLLFFPVDNVRNFGISDLRKKLEKASKGLDHVKKKVTLRHFGFLDLLICDKRDESDGQITRVKFDEVKFWSEKLGVERQHVDDLLRLFHETGMIFKFSKMRSLSDVVFTEVAAYVSKMCLVFNIDALNQTYDKLYNSENKEADEAVGHLNSYKKNFLVSRPMIDSMCDNAVDVELLITFMKEVCLVAEWTYDPELFFEGINLGNNIKAQYLDADVYFFPTLLNDKNTVMNYNRMKKKTRLMDDLEIADLESGEDEVGDDLKYEIFFEGHDKCVFPSSFFATFVAAIVNFLSSLKAKFDKMHPDRYGGDWSLADVKVYNKNGAATLKITVADLFGFYIRSEKNGLKVFIPREYREGAYATFVFVHSMLEKVNKEILGLGLMFAIRVKVKGKLRSLRHLRQKASKLQDVFNEMVGVTTFRVSGGISGIENYLRDHVRK